MSKLEGSEGRSVMLSKNNEIAVAKEKEAKKLASFMKRRKKNRDKEMSRLRSERLKLNKLSPKDIGK